MVGGALLSAQISTDTVRNILRSRIDEHKRNVGLVVGIVDESGKRVIVHGKRAAADARPLDGDTVFEIGSVTKAFTGLLLADMAIRGEVSLDDPAQKYLPEGTAMPQRGGRAITLRDLATHHSGLPRLPGNLKPADPANPYADYTPALLYEFLAGHALGRDPGAGYEYSNLGAGLLGHLLARRAGKNYEELLRERICDPLGMRDTRIALTPAMQARLAQGHGPDLQPAKNWDLDALAGAGAVRSTANDMLRLLDAAMAGKLGEKLERALAARKPAGPSLTVGLGWHVFEGDREIVWHNGGTGGYRSFAGFAPKSGRGVVVLTNTFFSADDIGLHLLDPSRKLQEFRKEIVLPQTVLDRYTGRYSFAPGIVLGVTSESGRLFVQLTGQPRFEVFAESEKKFFLKVVEAQLTFASEGDGKATAVTLHQNGRDQLAKRME
ncbi:MAG: serine hydrolase [Bryobacterales bacterium]|nr:serine hydrolase [Bryobacterales bacterium]